MKNIRWAPAAITVYSDNGDLVVSIKSDGSVIFGEGISPDVAARNFYQALAKEFAEKL